MNPLQNSELLEALRLLVRIGGVMYFEVADPGICLSKAAYANASGWADNVLAWCAELEKKLGAAVVTFLPRGSLGGPGELYGRCRVKVHHA